GGNASHLESRSTNGWIHHDARRSDVCVFRRIAWTSSLPAVDTFRRRLSDRQTISRLGLRMGASGPSSSSIRAASCSLLHLGGSRRALVRPRRLCPFLHEGGRGQR